MAFLGLLSFIICIYLRPGEWIPVFSGIRVMQIVAIATMIFMVFSNISSKNKFVSAPQNKLILGFIISLIMSHMVHFYLGGMKLAFNDFSKIVILYFLVVNIVNSITRFKITINLIIILTLLMAIQGIAQYNTGIGIAGQELSQGERITWIGTFGDPNAIALAFVIIIPFLLDAVFNPSSLGQRIINIPITAVVFYAIYLTNSRGGMLASIIVTFFYFMFYFKKRKNAFIGVLIGLLFAGILLYYSPSRMAAISSQEASAHGRLEAWYSGFQMILSSPLFGVGYRMFTDYHFRTAHNSIILCAAEVGLVGLFLWIGLFYFSFKNLFDIQKIKKGHPEIETIKSFAFLLALSIGGYLLNAFFISRTYILLPYILIALSVVLFNLGKKTKAALDNRFSIIDFRNIGLISLGSLVLTYLTMKVFI